MVADDATREAREDWRPDRAPRRYVAFQLAEVAVPRAPFAAILHRIDRLRGRPWEGARGAFHSRADLAPVSSAHSD